MRKRPSLLDVAMDKTADASIRHHPCVDNRIRHRTPIRSNDRAFFFLPASLDESEVGLDPLIGLMVEKFVLHSTRSRAWDNPSNRHRLAYQVNSPSADRPHGSSWSDSGIRSINSLAFAFIECRLDQYQCSFGGYDEARLAGRPPCDRFAFGQTYVGQAGSLVRLGAVRKSVNVPS